MKSSKDLANLLFPNVTLTVKELIEKYPPRNLVEGAEVTRFAPSPTGYVHIGNLYQCVINSFYAHQTGGIMFLRCEDTDKKREIEGAANILYPNLIRLGVKIDEGFISETQEAGNYGPYLQSRRTNYYQAFVKELVEKNLAYPCFCDDEEDNNDYQSEQKRLGVPTGYYGRWAKCRNLSYEQIEENIKKGKPFKIRIKSNGDGEKRIIFHDELRGDISFPENFVDYVILKSDGSALYHLAHLVDDSLMHTTLVIRDESWLPSAPLHLQLFNYMNLPHPKYIHTAQVMTIDQETGATRKISKRRDSWADTRWFIEQGYPIEAVTEYLLNLINSNFELWRKDNPFAQLSEFRISIDKMSKSGGIFDLEKLNSISRDCISKMSKELLFDLSYAWAKNNSPTLLKLIDKSHEYYKDILNIEREQQKPRKDFTTYADIESNIWYMYDDEFINREKQYEWQNINDIDTIKNICTNYISDYYSVDEDKDVWFSKIKDLADSLGYASDMKEYKKNPQNYKGNVADIATVIRVAFTSKSKTPDLYIILKMLGKDSLNKRLNLL